ncbi:MAG: restriction endonuclease subunit S [Synergistaceae bacterium]|nr:restriction endonuclease subunit S [Synergistaceae bacterium]
MVNYPDDWKETKIGDILKVKRGKRLVRRQLSNRGKYPVYQNSLDPLGFFESCNCAAQSAFIIAAGNAGDIGFSDTGFWAADDCFYFEDGGNITQKFLFYILQHKQYYIYSQTRRTSIPRLSQDVLEKILIPLPPLHEQQAIADTLSVFDTHITNLAELITKKKAIRDGALEDLMSGRTRLKGCSGDWEVKKLGEVASIQDGTHGTFARVQLGKLLLSAKNVFNNHLVITDNESMVSQSDYNKIIANGYPRKGDILISCVGTIGRCCLLERNDVAFQRSVAFIRPHKFYNKYLMFLLQSRSIQQQLTALINASAQGGVYLNSLKQINLLATTDEDEQQAIADTLTALDDEIASLEAERDKITQIRDGAMNDLLTGKVRLLNGN